MGLTKKGSIPIPYIIALILGIIVIALVAYWFFYSGGHFGRAVITKMCEGKRAAYCNDYKSTGETPKDYFSDACEDIDDKTKYYAPECCSLENEWGSTWDNPEAFCPD